MYSNAVAKLKTEIEQSKNNSYIQVVGEFLLSHLEKYPQDAEKVISADKTIVKSLDEMRKAAEKKKVGNCAVITPTEGFAIILKYFGIDSAGKEIQSSAAVPTVNVQKPVVTPKSKVDFDVSLDDFM